MPHRRQFLRHVSAASLLAAAPSLASRPDSARVPGQPSKIKDLIIYQHDQFYCAFPSVVCRPDGELLVAFRRAPDRKSLGEDRNSHTDPNSYLVLVRSKDNARTWSTEPELIFAHPYGGSQDPCMVQLKDGSIICTSYGWALLKPEAAAKMTATPKHGNFVFLGGYHLISKDSGRSWQGPYLPPPVPTSKNVGLFDKPLPAYNRGALCEGRDGRLFWVVADMEKEKPDLTSVHLMISTDRGKLGNIPAQSRKTPRFSSTRLPFTRRPKAIWSLSSAPLSLTITRSSPVRPMGEKASKPGRTPASRATPITRCDCPTSECCWSTDTATSRLAFGRACWMRNAAMLPRLLRLFCARMAERAIWDIRGQS